MEGSFHSIWPQVVYTLICEPLDNPLLASNFLTLFVHEAANLWRIRDRESEISFCRKEWKRNGKGMEKGWKRDEIPELPMISNVYVHPLHIFTSFASFASLVPVERPFPKGSGCIFGIAWWCQALLKYCSPSVHQKRNCISCHVARRLGTWWKRSPPDPTRSSRFWWAVFPGPCAMCN